MIQVINGKAALSIWIWRFLLTIPRGPLGLLWEEADLTLYDIDCEEPIWWSSK